MNTHLLHTLLKHFRMDFLAHFSALTEQDVGAIMAGTSETLLTILQNRYGYTHTQAQAAWHEFVLRYVDGHDLIRRTGPANTRLVIAYPRRWRSARRIPWRLWLKSISPTRLM